MTTPRPPTLLRGSVLVRALWLDGAWHDTAALRRLALASWAPGTLVLALDGGLLVRFPAARRMDCAVATGLPFVEAKDGLWAWPPTPEELAAATPGRLHRLRGGQREEIALATLRDAEPWTWFDVAAPIVAVLPLGPPPAPIAAPPSPDVRTRLGHPPAAPEALALQAELTRMRTAPAARPPGVAPKLAAGLLGWLQRRKAAATVRGGAPAGAPAAGGTSGTAIGAPSGPGPFGWLFGLVGLLGLLGGGRAAGGGMGGGMAGGMGGASAGAGGTGLARRDPAGPGWLERLAKRLAVPLLGPLLGQRHGRYLGELVDLFEKGDLDAALRRAIPLGGGGLGPSLPPALGLPTPRTDLALKLGGGGSSSSIHVDAEVMTLLRDLYKRALDKLVAEGRIEEAAFVLVELLRDHQGAIALLEKHEKFAVAAEIAEAAHLPPEVAVRLWVRAGKLDRAIQHARRTASFASSLLIVEKADPTRGLAFRAAYAAHLAAGGDPAAAVAVCWPEPTLRPLSLRWLDAALAAGGAAGVRLLPYRLLVDPTAFDDVWARARALLDGEEPEDIVLRAALATGLMAADSPGARTIARPLLRRAVADQARSPAHAGSLDKLRDFAADPALAVDLPRPVEGLLLWGRTAPLRWTVDASDRGATPVRDLALLPRGRVLVALGEAGARILDRRGRTVAVFDEPCDGLALHDAGSRAIAVARRAGTCRLARLDLEAGTATRWLDVPLGPFATTYDGSFWFVADGDALLALDPLAERATALWRVTTGGPIEALVRAERGVTVEVGGTVRQVWRYALPNLRLDERAPFLEDRWPTSGLGRHGDRFEAQPARATGEDAVLPLRRQDKGQATQTSSLLTLPAGLAAFAPRIVAGSGGITFVAGVTPDRAVALLYTDGRLVLSSELGGARHVVARLDGETLLLGDDLGRVEVYELGAGTRMRGLRV